MSAMSTTLLEKRSPSQRIWFYDNKANSLAPFDVTVVSCYFPEFESEIPSYIVED
jgi:hypothetical protein